jgi:hypothetical protein
VTDIKVCTEENSSQSSDIVICTEDQTTVPSDIKVCTHDGRIEESIDPCNDAAELFVSGDGDANVGDIYTASGGIGPYTWEFDTGTIDADGEITSIDACGSSGDPRGGVITATDSCGSSTGLSVRLAGGEWVFNSGASSQCPTSTTGGTVPCITENTITGTQKTEKWMAYFVGIGGNFSSCPEYIAYSGGCGPCSPCTAWLDPCQDNLPRNTCTPQVRTWHYRDYLYDWLCI